MVFLMTIGRNINFWETFTLNLLHFFVIKLNLIFQKKICSGRLIINSYPDWFTIFSQIKMLSNNKFSFLTNMTQNKPKINPRDPGKLKIWFFFFEEMSVYWTTYHNDRQEFLCEKCLTQVLKKCSYQAHFRSKIQKKARIWQITPKWS